MAIVTVGDILDRGRDFEARLETRYAEICDHAADGGVRLVAGYLARCRRRQEKSLSELEPGMLHRVRRVELKFDIPFNPDANPASVPEPPGGDALIEAAIRHDADVSGLYRAVLQQPLNEEARSVLEALVRVEERDMVMLKKMLAMHYF